MRNPSLSFRSFGRVLLLLVVCSPAFQQTAFSDEAAPAAVQRVLLVTGVDYPGHHWKETTPALRSVLERGGEMDVRVVEDHEFLASDAVFDYDLVVLHLKNYEPTRRAEAVRENLMRFVHKGGGLVAVHFACGAFEDWPEYKELVGRVWDKTLRAHDPRGPFSVRVVDRGHPITRDMDDFETDDELYTCLGAEGPEIRTLATARSKVDGKDYPIAFVLEIGRGRVFHTVLGHDVEALTLRGPAELIHRGCLWAAGRE